MNTSKYVRLYNEPLLKSHNSFVSKSGCIQPRGDIERGILRNDYRMAFIRLECRLNEGGIVKAVVPPGSGKCTSAKPVRCDHRIRWQSMSDVA